MKRIAVLTSLLLGLGSACSPRAHDDDRWFPPESELLDLIEARVARQGAGGIVLGVVESDGSARVVFAGDPGPGARELSDESVFQIGSLTKVFTAALLAVLAYRGALQISDRVADHLPPGTRLPVRAGREIRLVDLASHRSGLPRDVPGFDPADPRNEYPDYSVDQLLGFLGEVTLETDIGSQFQYSNVGFALLGLALESAGGAAYGELLRQEILEPLGMHKTGVELSETMSDWATVGYANGQVVPPQALSALVAAGGLRSDMRDMLAFLRANIGETGSALERAMRVAHGDPTSGLPELGWQRYELDGSTMLWMAGLLGGYRSFIGLDPDRDVGLVLLSNSSGPIDDIGGHLLNPAFPLRGD